MSSGVRIMCRGLVGIHVHSGEEGRPLKAVRQGWDGLVRDYRNATHAVRIIRIDSRMCVSNGLWRTIRLACVYLVVWD